MRTVVQLGMSRSGSTAVWQAVRAMVFGLDGTADGPARGHIVKAHEFDPEACGVPHVITVRDPLDCAASWAVAAGCDPAGVDPLSVLEPAMISGRHAMRAMDAVSDALWLRYERWWDDVPSMVLRVRQWLSGLGFELAERDVGRVAAHVSRAKNAERAAAQGDSFAVWCGNSLVHGRHVSDDPTPGKWTRVFPESMWRDLMEAAAPVRVGLGYE